MRAAIAGGSQSSEHTSVCGSSDASAHTSMSGSGSSLTSGFCDSYLLVGVGSAASATQPLNATTKRKAPRTERPISTLRVEDERVQVPVYARLALAKVRCLQLTGAICRDGAASVHARR